MEVQANLNSATDGLPGPTEIPILSAIQYLAAPIATLERWSATYGDDFGLGRSPRRVFLSSPEALQSFFSLHPVTFCSSSRKSVDNLLLSLLGENSPALISGNQHLQRRELLKSSLSRWLMPTHIDLIYRIVDNAIQKWSCTSAPIGKQQFKQITLDLIFTIVFGSRQSASSEALKKAWGAASRWLNMSSLEAYAIDLSLRWATKGWWSYRQRLLNDLQNFDRRFYAEIHDRRSNPSADDLDLLTLLVSHRDELGQCITESEIRDIIVTTLVASSESVASVLTWAIYANCSYAQVRTKLQQDLSTLTTNPSASEIAKLAYFNAFCKETMRIYTPLNALPRALKLPTQVGNYHFTAGTVIFPSIYLAHHRADTFPEPKQFRPERFLERRFSAYEYLPLGGGHRRCLGEHLGLYQIKVILAKLLLELDFALESKRSFKPVVCGFQNLQPPPQLRFTVKRKS